MEDVFWAAFRNDEFVFWMAITLIVIVPATGWTLTEAWSRNRQAELDASLKHRMLEMGMTAEEIERVIAAKTPSDEAAVF